MSDLLTPEEKEKICQEEIFREEAKMKDVMKYRIFMGDLEPRDMKFLDSFGGLR